MASKHVLAAMPDRSAANGVKKIMGPEFRVDWAEHRPAALKMLQTRDYEFTFLDLEFLLDGLSNASMPKEALQPFQQSSPGRISLFWRHRGCLSDRKSGDRQGVEYE